MKIIKEFLRDEEKIIYEAGFDEGEKKGAGFALVVSMFAMLALAIFFMIFIANNCPQALYPPDTSVSKTISSIGPVIQPCSKKLEVKYFFDGKLDYRCLFDSVNTFCGGIITVKLPNKHYRVLTDSITVSVK